MPEMMKCKDCGAEIPYFRTRIYCGACRKRRDNESNRRYRETHLMPTSQERYQNTTQYKQIHTKKKRKDNMADIGKVAKRANEAGMTYGQYVALFGNQENSLC